MVYHSCALGDTMEQARAFWLKVDARRLWAMRRLRLGGKFAIFLK